VAARVLPSEIDTIYLFRPLKREGREWGTAAKKVAGSHGDVGPDPRRNDKPAPVGASEREKRQEKARNLRRVGSLARDEPGLRFVDTLRSRRDSSS